MRRGYAQSQQQMYLEGTRTQHLCVSSRRAVEGVGAGDTLSVTTPDGEDSRGRVCHYVPILI